MKSSSFRCELSGLFLCSRLCQQSVLHQAPESNFIVEKAKVEKKELTKSLQADQALFYQLVAILRWAVSSISYAVANNLLQQLTSGSNKSNLYLLRKTAICIYYTLNFLQMYALQGQQARSLQETDGFAISSGNAEVPYVL